MKNMNCILSDEINRFRALLLLGSAFLSTPGLAQSTQTPAANDQGLAEIVVTAQRVAQPLQKTPASISVLTADTLETAGVQNLGDVSHLIPNLTFTDGYRAGVPQISLRGIPTVQGGDPPAAFVVDGVQVPSLDFVNQDLLDIANVQVLRGPQGGIYGRDAIGGAVVIETQRPTDQFHDTLMVDGGNGEFLRAVNTASGPIVPGQLWGKLTLNAHYYGGLIQNIDLHEPADSMKDYAGRAEILAKLTETTTVDLTYSHTQGIEGASYQAILPNYAIGDFKQYQPDFNKPINDHRYIDTYAAKIDQVTPLGTLTSISQYAQTRSTVTGDADWTPAPIVNQWNAVGVKAVNEDLHFASPAGQAIHWIVGGFYQLRQTENNLNVFFEPSPGGNQFCGCAGGFADSVLLDDDHNSSLARAAYGQASVPLPANFKFDVALRYDSDRRADEDRSIPAGPNNAISQTFQAFQPNGTLSQQFTPDLMGYFTVGKGFRSGGFNAYTDSVASGSLVHRQYPAETDLNYEVGIKSQFFDHHLTVNADVFHTQFDNEQYYLVNISPPARDIVTIRSVTFNGGELEVSYLPVDGLTLNASVGLADSRINSNDLDQNDLGKHSPQANRYTADISALYRQPLWDDYSVLYRLDYSYKGPICYDSANQYCFHSVGFLNARVGLENHRYTVALWAKNIFSIREPIVFGPNDEGPGVSTQMVNQPATYGVEVIARF
jgi:iron complex outermembrane receptor protein